MRTIQFMLILALALVALSSGVSALGGAGGCGWTPSKDSGIPNGQCVGPEMSDKCSSACRREFVTNATGECRDGGVCECYYCTNISPPCCSNGTSTNVTTKLV
ncbi:hypothetical protein SETIT_1G063100v2 [Setaria italica]|nr:hypothetical protein SETIT_1G063100v2 [Setaria italica]TKW37656.1 hypothetical protein SEVIR_1G062300v2 [Setaria viridis]